MVQKYGIVRSISRCVPVTLTPGLTDPRVAKFRALTETGTMAAVM